MAVLTTKRVGQTNRHGRLLAYHLLSASLFPTSSSSPSHRLPPPFPPSMLTAVSHKGPGFCGQLLTQLPVSSFSGCPVPVPAGVIYPRIPACRPSEYYPNMSKCMRPGCAPPGRVTPMRAPYQTRQSHFWLFRVSPCLAARHPRKRRIGPNHLVSPPKTRRPPRSGGPPPHPYPDPARSTETCPCPSATRATRYHLLHAPIWPQSNRNHEYKRVRGGLHPRVVLKPW